MRFLYRTTVEFADTDMAGIMHFSNFFRFMERAEHAFWRSIGLSVHTGSGEDVASWPRVQATCEYRAPLRFEDEIDVEVSVKEIRSKAIIFGFRFRKVGAADFAAEGAITAVCAAYSRQHGRMKAVDIPADVLERIRSAAT